MKLGLPKAPPCCCLWNRANTHLLAPTSQCEGWARGKAEIEGYGELESIKYFIL